MLGRMFPGLDTGFLLNHRTVQNTAYVVLVLMRQNRLVFSVFMLVNRSLQSLWLTNYCFEPFFFLFYMIIIMVNFNSRPNF